MTDFDAGVHRRRRPVEWIGLERLQFDPENPRLEDESLGATQDDLAMLLSELYDAQEVAASIRSIGYFRPR